MIAALAAAIEHGGGDGDTPLHGVEDLGPMPPRSRATGGATFKLRSERFCTVRDLLFLVADAVVSGRDDEHQRMRAALAAAQEEPNVWARRACIMALLEDTRDRLAGDLAEAALGRNPPGSPPGCMCLVPHHRTGGTCPVESLRLTARMQATMDFRRVAASIDSAFSALPDDMIAAALEGGRVITRACAILSWHVDAFGDRTRAPDERKEGERKAQWAFQSATRVLDARTPGTPVLAPAVQAVRMAGKRGQRPPKM